jgi:hypothetical protein
MARSPAGQVVPVSTTALPTQRPASRRPFVLPDAPALVGDRRVQKRHQGVSCFPLLEATLASIMQPTIKQGLSGRLLQAWFVPRIITVSPGRKSTLSTSVTRYISPMTQARQSSASVRCTFVAPKYALTGDPGPLISRISRRISSGTVGRSPRGRDFQGQYDLNPARCQRTMVSGFTIANASQILGNNR